MNRLDRHVGKIQNKLTLDFFLSALGYALAIFAAVVLIDVLVERFFWKSLPHVWIWFWSAAGMACIGAVVTAVLRRPSPMEVAVFIDDKLGLKEKFSTAMYARQQNALHGGATDPFMLAAVKDAERTADNVSVHRRFPVEFPKSSFVMLTATVVTLLVWYFLPEKIDLFGTHARSQALAHKVDSQRQEAMHQAERAMTVISSQSAAMKNMPRIELAHQEELKKMMADPKTDPVALKQTAMKAQEEAEAAAKLEEVKANQAYAEAQAQTAMFSALNPAADDKGPVATASREIANGDFSKAVDALKDLPAKFNDLTPEQQKKQVDQMKQMANQLNKLANDPSAMKNLQQQLKQQGITQQQVQQAAQLAQQAAQGNQQAAQQLQQMQQQMTQQMNGGQGPTQQQQQAIAQAMQQMQSVANTQATAQQMTAAAQQMVQGMQQAQAQKQGGTQAGQQQANAKMGNAQQQGSKPGGQTPSGQQGQGAQAQSGGNQPGQQPGGQQPGGQQPGQQPGGQQPGAAQANGSQPGGQQPGGQQPGGQQGSQPGGQQANGSQPGGQQGAGQGDGQQQMKNAGDQMAQALGQMDAVKKDAEQVAAAQKAGQHADDQSNNTGGDGKGSGKGGQKAGGQGQGKLGQGNGQKGNGMGGPGIGAGGSGEKQEAPYTVQQELDPSQNIAGGKVLAKSFVKAPTLKGKASIELSPAQKAAMKDSTDDVSESSIPKDAQKVVKDYFDGN